MKYYFLVSGGKDSTAMLLKAFEEGIKGELLYGYTRINSKGSLEVIERLSTYTGFPLHIARYEGEKKPIQILRESFVNIPKALDYMKETGIFRRNMFHCCDILKHQPMQEFQKQHKDACFVLGIKGSDGAIHRRYRMRQLREQDTFYREHKTGYLFYYPLRDWTKEQVQDMLKKHGFQDVHSTGCSICPIFCLFESWKNKDPDTWRRSVLFADRLGIEHPASGQQFLNQLCGGIES
jgi:3'-phosphoadenosine 5'-phosphosulfate sulfotransferase (PAPS reductase)/FAD synthetase